MFSSKSSPQTPPWTHKKHRARQVDAVFCGPPGSGKSYLRAAMLFGAGQRRDGYAVTPIGNAPEEIDRIRRHMTSGRAERHGGESTLHVQLTAAREGSNPDEPTRELALLELGGDSIGDHPLRRELCFAPVWVLLMDPQLESRSWYLDRLATWSRDLAIVDGQAAVRPDIGSGLPLTVPREARRIRKLVVVLTHMDHVARQWMPNLQARPLHQIVGHLRRPEDLEHLMRRVDAEAWIQQADVTFLNRVRGFLGGFSTEVYVGSTSAVGWTRPSSPSGAWCPFGTDQLLRLILDQQVEAPFHLQSPLGKEFRSFTRLSVL